jgi:fructan beta-fructosidase
MRMKKPMQSSAGVETYEEPYRPQLHFTPESQWMNDPNGMVYYEGEYHLFYQYHPYSRQWGPMHWGHAVSEDMFAWKHLPIALAPDELGMIFSGSIVVDWEDSSGFFDGENGLVAVYTSAKGDFQQQSIAYSVDRGRTWTKYEGNPVIPNPGKIDFRDPKVFYHDDSARWIMVLAAGQEVMFYTSEDLKTWEFASAFGAEYGAHGGVWECPDLLAFSVPGEENSKWVLQVDIGDGAAAGGSGGQYFLGNFDGKVFTADTEPEDVQWIDYGKDYYATQSFSDIPEIDGRRIWLAWMSNWQYANEVPTEPWRSAMSLPREVNVIKNEDGRFQLTQLPVAELEAYTEDIFIEKSVGIMQTTKQIICEQPSTPFKLEVSLPLDKKQPVTLELFDNADAPGCEVKVNAEAGTISFDRSKMKKSGFHKDFPAVTTAPFDKSREMLKLLFVVDRSSVEIFINDGEQTMCNLILPENQSNYYISGKGNSEIHLKGEVMHSVWK